MQTTAQEHLRECLVFPLAARPPPLTQSIHSVTGLRLGGDVDTWGEGREGCQESRVLWVFNILGPVAKENQWPSNRE
jgi:hypothetical protein